MAFPRFTEVPLIIRSDVGFARGFVPARETDCVFEP